MSPVFPREWQGMNEFLPKDEELAALPCRVTLLLGTGTQRPYRAVVGDLVERIPGVRVIPLPGLNHVAPLLAPEALAEHLAQSLRP